MVVLARLYGMARVHKKINLRDMSSLSLRGNSHEKLSRKLANFFDEIEGAINETKTESARVMIVTTKLDSDESIISLYMKNM